MAITLVDKNTEPSTPFDVWEPLALLRPNWGSGMGVASTYTTAVFKADSGAETRRGLNQKPTRTLSFDVQNWAIAEQFDLVLFFERLTRARTLTPLWCDFSELTQDAALNDTRIYLETDYRRFVTGEWIVLFDPQDGQRVVTDYHLVEVTDIQTGYLDVTALPAAASTGWIVAPTVITDPVFSNSSDFKTDQHAISSLVLTEATL